MCFIKRKKKQKLVAPTVEKIPDDHVAEVKQEPKITSLEEYYCYNNPECDECNLLEMAEIL